MKKGEYVVTPRFMTVMIEEVFQNREEAWLNGYREPTHYYDGEYGIAGKSKDMYHMTFAAYKEESR